MIEKMDFPVPLTDRELLAAADLSSMISKAIEEKEAVFSDIKHRYKEELGELKEALSFQMKKLIDKTEVRNVEVEILFNTPEEGKKTFRDPKTQDVLQVADMTEDDKENLFVNAEVNCSKDEEDEEIPYPCNEDEETKRRRAGIPKFTGNTIGAAMEETKKESEICSVCHECHSVLHISADKPICGVCRDKRNAKNITKFDELAIFWQTQKKQPCFRVTFGFGCIPTKRDTTCFRFMLESGSWGNPIYLAGDYAYTGSQSFAFYKELVKHGWREG